MPGSSSQMPYAPQEVKGFDDDDDDDIDDDQMMHGMNNNKLVGCQLSDNPAFFIANGFSFILL